MKKSKLVILTLVLGILCIILSVIVFIFADGLRRWYSGIFFLLIGTVTLINAVRWQHVDDRQSQSSE